MTLDRRSFIKGSIAGAVTGSLAGPLIAPHKSRASSQSKQQPNFIFILADDMRWDALGVMGNRVIHTPNLDALAEDGSLFRNNFVTTSICPVSRASIFTGQYARYHNIWDFNTPLSAQQLSAIYPVLLRQAGYRTGFIGKWGLGGALPTEAFDYWRGFPGQGNYFEPNIDHPEHLTITQEHQALAFLEDHSSDRPFYLSVHTKAPHAQDGADEAFQPDSRYAPLYEHVTIPTPATATTAHFDQLPPFLQTSEARVRWDKRLATPAQFQHTVKQYYRLITGIDDLVGSVVKTLRAKNLYDNTCIIFSSDNGYMLGEHGLIEKWFGFEESIRTPLIIKPPFKSSAQSISAMTLNIDLFPTILELAGTPAPKALHGHSIIPLLQGNETALRNEYFYEHLVEIPSIAKCEGIRTQQHKYLHYTAHNGEAGEFLFDLNLDPLEETNLATLAAHHEQINQYRKNLEMYRKKYA